MSILTINFQDLYRQPLTSAFLADPGEARGCSTKSLVFDVVNFVNIIIWSQPPYSKVLEEGGLLVLQFYSSQSVLKLQSDREKTVFHSAGWVLTEYRTIGGRGVHCTVYSAEYVLTGDWPAPPVQQTVVMSFLTPDLGECEIILYNLIVGIKLFFISLSVHPCVTQGVSPPLGQNKFVIFAFVQNNQFFRIKLLR